MWAMRQRVQALANCRVGAVVEEYIAADVEVLVVCGLLLLVAEGTGNVVIEGLETWFYYVAWGAFEPGRNDFPVVGEVV
jgi:hypothetical protein